MSRVYSCVSRACHMRPWLWLNIRERKTISVHNDRQNTGLQVNLEVLKSQQQTHSFLFNSGIIELIFVKLAGEIANGVVQTLHIFHHCSSPNFQFERSGQLRCSEHGVWQRRDLALSKAPWHSSDQTKSIFGQEIRIRKTLFFYIIIKGQLRLVNG